MAGHHLVGGLGVLMLLPALGQHELFALLEHRELANFREIAGKIGITNETWKIAYGHIVPFMVPVEAS